MNISTQELQVKNKKKATLQYAYSMFLIFLTVIIVFFFGDFEEGSTNALVIYTMLGGSGIINLIGYFLTLKQLKKELSEIDILKQELYENYNKQVKKETLKFGLISAPFILLLLFYTFLADETGIFISMILYLGVTLILGIPYLIKMIKSQKEYKQNLSELEDN